MIKRIKLDSVKGIDYADYEIGKLNLLLGPNGSGKTSILSSIGILIEGRHPKNGKLLQNIMEICPSDSLSVEVEVERDGIASTFKRRVFTTESLIFCIPTNLTKLYK